MVEGGVKIAFIKMNIDNTKKDKPMAFHKSFSELLDTFRSIIVSVLWLKVSVESAERYFESHKYIVKLPCSIGIKNQVVFLDKSIFNLIKEEGINGPAPLTSKALTNFYRIFTIAIKDIIWKEKDFEELLDLPELQFLYHLRNASAHNNLFYWGNEQQRKKNVKKFPIQWRNKIIKEELENKKLYMDFISPGDLFVLLSDITSLVIKNNKC